MEKVQPLLALLGERLGPWTRGDKESAIMKKMEGKGLREREAVSLLEKYGENLLPKKAQRGNLRLLFAQIKSPLIYILLFAAGVTVFLGDYKDTLVILFAVFLNTILGFYQEAKAEKALAALSKILQPYAKVVRDSKVKLVEAKLLVPGDLVLLAPGDRVPADGVLVEAVSLSVNEAILTGESLPVGKEEASATGPARPSFPKNTLKGPLFGGPPPGLSPVAPGSSAANLIFMGTTVVSGRGKFLVTATGQASEMGKIAGKLATIEQEKTPLQKRLGQLAKTLAVMVALISLAILVIGLAAGNSFVEMFTTSVAVAVAAIPEGMVVSLTVILAIGMQRILRRKALVRKLLAAETLGSVTLIATDKTGTLTEGVMRVSKVELTDKEEARRAAVFANNLEDPLEVALWDWAKSQGLDAQKLSEENPRVSEEPFESEKKYMSVTINDKINKTYKTYIKGGPEVVLSKCQVSGVKYQEWMRKVEKWSGEGLRLIGLAQAEIRNPKSEIRSGSTGSPSRAKSRDKFKIQNSNEQNNLHWLGLIGIEDPVRADVGEVFEQTRRAGIRTMMVTGDYAGTARAVWGKIVETGHAPSVPQAMDGAELEKCSQEELRKRVRETEIFARVSPSDKLKIVEALKENGEVVALVGDGVNDAPAIKRADIGIVVGEASDVARETADMVLLDSNFKTILAAIEEGRGIFENIKKVILYLLSDSFSEVILVSLSILSGVPLPLTAAQILWINLLTDGFPNLALTVEPKEAGLLRRKPLSLKSPLIDREMKILIAIISGITGLTSFLIFLYFWSRFGIELARTVTFTALGVDSLLYVFSVRSLTKPLWEVNHLQNPYLLLAVVAGFFLQLVSLYHPFFQKFLETVPLGIFEWEVVLGVSFLVIALIEGIKFFFNRLKFSS